MNTPHKHADVLRAVADGRAVQFMSEATDCWADYTDKINITPMTHARFQWRIKPEPKPDVVCVGRAGANAWSFHTGGDGKPNLRLVFDGEDWSKLKSAEVLP